MGDARIGGFAADPHLRCEAAGGWIGRFGMARASAASPPTHIFDVGLQGGGSGTWSNFDQIPDHAPMKSGIEDAGRGLRPRCSDHPRR